MTSARRPSQKPDPISTICPDLSKRLGITTSALYMYGDGSVKDPGQKLLDAAQDA